MTFILAADGAGMIWKRITPEKFRAEEYCPDADIRDPRSMKVKTSGELADCWGMASRPEIECIRNLAEQLPSGSQAVIIGAAIGTISMAILEGAPAYFHLWSMDIDPANHESAFLSNVGLWDHHHITKIWGDSYEIGKWWQNTVDLLIIDGDHTKEGVAKDLEVWPQHVKIGGIMVCHDYVDSEQTGMQAKPAIDEWLAKGRPFVDVESPASLKVLRRVAL